MQIIIECFNNDKGEFGAKEGRAVAAILMQIPGWEKTEKRKVIGPYGKQSYHVRATKKND